MSISNEAIAPRSEAAPSVWSAIREALSGAHGRDFTEGPIGRAIFILAVPMVLEMVMESVFAVVDVFVVAHLGADAVATVGLTESFMTIIYALADGAEHRRGRDGGAPHRREGRGGRGAHGGAGAHRSGSLVSLVLGVLGAWLAPQLLARDGRDRPACSPTSSFTRIMLGCNASVVMLFLVNAVLAQRGRRGDRDARAVAGERDQHRARPRARVRAGVRSQARHRGRGDRDDDRPQRWARCSRSSRLRAPGGRVRSRRASLRGSTSD